MEFFLFGSGPAALFRLYPIQLGDGIYSCWAMGGHRTRDCQAQCSVLLLVLTPELRRSLNRYKSLKLQLIFEL